MSELGWVVFRAGRRLLALAGCIVPLVSLTIAAPLAQSYPGDPAQGHRLAGELCKTCHLVDPGHRGVFLDGSPSLQDVADAPDTTALGLRVFFQTPHGSMPDLILSDAEVADLIAYILSLK